MLRAGLALAVLIGLAVPATAAPPSPDPKSLAVPPEELSKARELVRKLGSEVFVEREDAERDLAAMGRAARPALLDGVSVDPDPEIRARCRTLLPKATAAEMKVRLETFLADTEGKYEHDLPGWNKLRAVVRGDWTMLGWTFTARPGADKAARELFVEFLNAPGGRKLLTALGAGATDLGSVVAAMKQELYNMRLSRAGNVPRNPTVMEVAVVMFADSQTKFQGGPRNTVFSSVMSTSGVIQAAQGTDDKSAGLRAVLGAWIDSRTDPYEMYSAMNLAVNAGHNDVAGRVAVRLLSSAAAPAVYRGYAFNTLARIKSKEHLPAVEKLLGDETVATTISTNINGKLVQTKITVGDMALSAAVLMTGQKLEDYGIEDRLKGSPTSISYTRYILPEEKRKDAAEKWKAWREKNP